MTDDTKNEPDVMFYQLVLSLQASAMQNLGKVMSPMTNKIERNLEAAKYSIDLLEMFQKKTSGNLVDDEKSLLDRILYELRMNYVDESKKPDIADQDKESSEKQAESESQSSPEQPEDRAERAEDQGIDESKD